MRNKSFLEWPIYNVSAQKKQELLSAELTNLTVNHIHACDAYARILAARGISSSANFNIETIPFIPVRLFKQFELRSIQSSDVFKTLTSSGTTGQIPSKIYLDRETANFQTTILVRIMQEYLGKERLPMLIIDHPGVIKDRKNFSARGAGILGLSNFGRAHVYALHDDMSINIEAVKLFCEKYKGQKKFIFGFTFMIWQSFIIELEKKGIYLELDNSIMVHSGGWKKLQDLAVDNTTFKKRINSVCGAVKIHNFYGMVEQVGSIFVECEEGYLHAPSYADILIRNPLNWSLLENGHEGVVQVLSCLPRSYPGHSLLTEDLGTVHGEDDCNCGRMGRYFTIRGRIPHAEVRGCSDTQSA